MTKRQEGENACYQRLYSQRDAEGGEPCALKGASTVRRGGKGSHGFACPTLPWCNAPCPYPTASLRLPAAAERQR